jgi:hypothetical protein
MGFCIMELGCLGRRLRLPRAASSGLAPFYAFGVAQEKPCQYPIIRCCGRETSSPSLIMANGNGWLGARVGWESEDMHGRCGNLMRRHVVG